MRKFVVDTERFFGEDAMTFNVHQLLHVCDSIRDWGPGWAHSGFPFETENGHTLKQIHAANGVHNQIVRFLGLQRSYEIMLNHEKMKQNFPIAEAYIESSNTKITKNSIKINEIRYLGAFGDEKWIQELKLSRTSRSYKRIVKDSCLYATCLKVNNQSDNSFAMFSDERYVHLYEFIVDL